MVEFEEAVRRRIAAKGAQPRYGQPGTNPLHHLGVTLSGSVSRMDQFYQGFDRARSPEVSDGPSDEPR